MRALILAALTMGALSVPAQAGENWREVATVEGVIFAVDLDSIKTVGGLRHFRIRTTSPASTRIGYYDNAANCAGMTVDTLFGQVSDKGVILRKQAMKPGEMRNRLDDAQGKRIYPLVCG